MAGFDFAERLRRGLGDGNVLPAAVIAKRLTPFDSDGDEALILDELTQFFLENDIGPWFSKCMAKSFWSLCETWYGQEIAWIKIEALSKLISDVMAQPPPHSKRRRTDPEAMQGYREVESLEDYEKRSERGSEAPPPRVRKKKKKVRPRAGPRKRSGRPGPRKGPRR